jgi:hypothetical protein
VRHLVIILVAFLLSPLVAGEPVVAERVPDGGIQPQAVIDGSGTTHVVWFSGPAQGGNLFYARRSADGAGFGAALRVNSQDGSAIAMGTIRGAQMAIGKGGRIHVLWNGTEAALPKGPDGGAGMLYTRLTDDGSAFEPQRQLIQRAGGIDGGGSIVADVSGHVWAFWHAMAGAKDESGRAVYVAASSDDGATFANEQPATTIPTGACGCCGMRAGIDGQGRLYVLYRGAAKGQRDEILLSRGKDQKTFTGLVLDPWNAQTCPMSTSAIMSAGERTVLAWETKGRIFFATGKMGKPGMPTAVSTAAAGSKHPTIAINGSGELLIAWTEGTGWNKGGTLAWQRFDAQGKPIGSVGRADGLPAWGLPSAVAKPDGSFMILY